MGAPGGFIRAQVLSHDPENDGFYAMTASAQILPLVRRLYDQADGMRIKKKPMPVRGSWVLLGFAGGDMRAPFMMGAYHPNLVDSLPDDKDDPFSDYESNFNGSWAYTHGISGHSAQQFADNSSFVMGSGDLSLPTMYRHTVTSGQARQRIQYSQADRNPKPQKPFGWKWSQAVSGGLGGLTFTQSVSGDLTVTSAVTGRSLTFTFNGSTYSIDASGNINAAMASSKNFVITQGGGAANDFLALATKLVTAFNAHTHPGTSTPSTPWTNTTINSTAIKISN